MDLSTQMLQHKNLELSYQKIQNLSDQMTTCLGDVINTMPLFDYLKTPKQLKAALEYNGFYMDDYNLSPSEQTFVLEGFFSSVWDTIKRIWEAIVNLFKKIFSFGSETKESVEKDIKALKAIEYKPKPNTDIFTKQLSQKVLDKTYTEEKLAVLEKLFDLFKLSFDSKEIAPDIETIAKSMANIDDDDASDLEPTKTHEEPTIDVALKLIRINGTSVEWNPELVSLLGKLGIDLNPGKLTNKNQLTGLIDLMPKNTIQTIHKDILDHKHSTLKDAGYKAQSELVFMNQKILAVLNKQELMEDAFKKFDTGMKKKLSEIQKHTDQLRDQKKNTMPRSKLGKELASQIKQAKNSLLTVNQCYPYLVKECLKITAVYNREIHHATVAFMKETTVKFE